MLSFKGSLVHCTPRKHLTKPGLCPRTVGRTSARSASSDRQVVAEPIPTLSFSHLLTVLLDKHEYLAEGSKTALATAAGLAAKDQGKVTVLVIAEEGTTANDPQKQVEAISWHLKDKGCTDFSVLQRATTQPASVLVGDVADELAADMVVVSSEAVHAKHVDANQLAEFVSVPLLVCP